MTLSDQAATGSADREAVAKALGWKRARTDYHWKGWLTPSGIESYFTPPDYQRDLAATLAEIERRGWRYHIGNYPSALASVWEPLRSYSPTRNATLEGTTIANAACAALLKALENSDDR